MTELASKLGHNACGVLAHGHQAHSDQAGGRQGDGRLKVETTD